MPRSFYYGTDAALAAGARAFADAIGANPAAYGISQQQADDYALLAQAYIDAYRLTTAPSTRTAVTVSEKNLRRRELRRATALLAKRINGDPDVAAEQRIALGLSVARPASPPQPPGTPAGFSAELAQIGTLTLRWQCDHPNRLGGVIYLVSRRAGDTGEFIHLGFTGKKKFVDATIPAGTTMLTYQVQAARSNAAGSPARYTVRFGTGPLPAAMLRTLTDPKTMHHAA